MTELLHYPFSMVRYFVPEFIHRMRRIREVVEKPSPRQGIAMCDLLMPRYMRKGELSIQDLVDVAVYTSKVDNQDVAQRVAIEILMNVEESEAELPELDTDALLGLMAPRHEEKLRFEFGEENDAIPGEIKPLYDSDEDIFRKFSSKPDIGVGPGEDELIKQAIKEYKNRRDRATRMKLAEFLKLKLLNLAIQFRRKMEFLNRPIIRPYQYGDDANDIDEDRSLENIFDQGKTAEDVTYDDFFIRKKEKRKKAIIFILDISNTMFYQLEGLTSIHYSVMSLVPLIWSLQKERYGLVFYESNSHIHKELHEERDIDDIVDGLLYLVTSTTGDVEKIFKGTQGTQTWGGTMPTMSLRWALEELRDAGDRTEKICFFFSDFVLDEPGVLTPEKMENYSIIGKMEDLGIHVVACVSPLAKGDVFSPYTENVLNMVRESGAEMIETEKPIDFLDRVQEFLEQI